MDHTQNYHLPQWEKTDRIMMEDFNQAMAELEKGLTTAQTTADGAQQTADTARTEAAVLPYAVGQYKSSATANTTVTLGFRPRFLVATSQQSDDSNASYASSNIAATDGTFLTGIFEFTSTGFIVKVSTDQYPRVHNGYTCAYIAFR